MICCEGFGGIGGVLEYLIEGDIERSTRGLAARRGGGRGVSELLVDESGLRGGKGGSLGSLPLPERTKGLYAECCVESASCDCGDCWGYEIGYGFIIPESVIMTDAAEGSL